MDKSCTWCSNRWTEIDLVKPLVAFFCWAFGSVHDNWSSSVKKHFIVSPVSLCSQKFIFIIHWHAVLYNDVLIIEISILSPLWLNWIKFQRVFFFFGYFTNFLILFERKGITGSIMVICCSAWLVNRTAWPYCSNFFFSFAWSLACFYFS